MSDIASRELRNGNGNKTHVKEPAYAAASSLLAKIANIERSAGWSGMAPYSLSVVGEYGAATVDASDHTSFASFEQAVTEAVTNLRGGDEQEATATFYRDESALAAAMDAMEWSDGEPPKTWGDE